MMLVSKIKEVISKVRFRTILWNHTTQSEMREHGRKLGMDSTDGLQSNGASMV